MARELIEGFEAGQLDLWTLFGAPVPTTSIAGMDGTYCVYCNGAIGFYRAVTSRQEYYGAFLFRTATGGNYPLINFYDGATEQGCLQVSAANGYLRVMRGAGTLLDTATTGQIITNTTYLIEFYYKAADTGGRWTVKLNGVQVIDYTGDTQASGNPSVDRFGVAYDGVLTCSGYFDNIVLDSAAWIGKTYIQKIVPTGAGTSTQWTPSAGSNYQTVDEVPASDADFNEVNAAAQLDTFAAGNLVGSIGAVLCVQLQARAFYEGAPTPTKLKLAVRSGTTNYYGSDETLTTVAKAWMKLWETDPDTAAAWTESGVNAAEIGYASVA